MASVKNAVSGGADPAGWIGKGFAVRGIDPVAHGGKRADEAGCERCAGRLCLGPSLLTPPPGQHRQDKYLGSRGHNPKHPPRTPQTYRTRTHPDPTHNTPTGLKDLRQRRRRWGHREREACRGTASEVREALVGRRAEARGKGRHSGGRKGHGHVASDGERTRPARGGPHGRPPCAQTARSAEPPRWRRGVG